MQTTDAIDAIRDLVQQVLTSYEELDRRFAPSGGLAALADVHERLRRDLDRVGDAELAEMAAEVKRLVEVLVRMDFELRTVRELKRAFAGGAPAGE